MGEQGLLRNPNVLFTQNVNLTTTDVADVVTIPNGFVGQWTMTFITNLDNSNNDVTLFVDKTPDPDVYILNSKTINSKDYLMIESNSGFILQPGDVIKASCDTVGNLEVVVTLDLVYSPFKVNSFGTGGGG